MCDTTPTHAATTQDDTYMQSLLARAHGLPHACAHDAWSLRSQGDPIDISYGHLDMEGTPAYPSSGIHPTSGIYPTSGMYEIQHVIHPACDPSITPTTLHHPDPYPAPILAFAPLSPVLSTPTHGHTHAVPTCLDH